MNLRVRRSIGLVEGKLTKSAPARSTQKVITSAIMTLKIVERAAI
jgi:hypothetical protein